MTEPNRKSRSLQVKMGAIYLVLGIAFSCGSYAILQQLVFPTFETFEQEQAAENIVRVKRTIDSEIEALVVLNREYSQWDHTVDFVHGNQPEYVEDNLDAEYWLNIGVQMTLIYGLTGDLVWGKLYDPLTGEELSLEDEFFEPLISGHPLVHHESTASGTTGLLKLKSGLMMVASSPVQATTGRGPVVGSFIVGRFMTEEWVKDLGQRASVHVSLLPSSHKIPPSTADNVPPGFTPLTESHQIRYTDDHLLSYEILPEVTGRDATLLEVETPRRITTIGTDIIGMALFFQLFASAIFVFVSWLLLRYLIVDPIHKLKNHVTNILQTGDLSQKMHSQRSDEIGSLAREFDNMTVALDLSQSALQEARDEAMNTSRAKSEFLATMSHEIRTPMNGVIGMTEMLLKTDLSNEQQRFTETVRRSGETLLGIINDILDFSKIEAGKISLEHTNFNLRDLIEDLGELFSIRAHSKQLELACMVPSNIPEAMKGDPTRLRQIITNLVGNAVKFTETGEVMINVKLLEETDTAARLRIEVKDTGIGLRPEEIERVFESFSQADGSTTRKYGGTGLGLAIARRLVGLMGGELSVDSVHGQGSVFWFELELEKQQGGQDTNTDRSTQLIDCANLHVLVVDDNLTNREILDHHLEAWDIRHSCCEGGAQALELMHAALADSNPFNLVILDYHMPEMDGLELARTISTDSHLSGTRMVMFSSADNIDMLEVRRDFEIDCSITKPVRQSELYDCLINKKVPEYRGTDHELYDEAPAATAQHISPRQILLVEDNKINQAVAIAMLKKLGYRSVHIANNGSEALDKVEQTHYDVILMDMQMPVMDGYEATAALRVREQAFAAAADGTVILHTPIVALTANVIQGDRENCLAAGADDYLGKPYTSGELRDVLEKWLPQLRQMVISPTQQDTATEAVVEPADSVSDGPGTQKRIESSASPIDQSALDTIRDMEDEEDPNLLAEIIGLYLDDSAELLQSLQAAIADKDSESMRLAAHTLKSSSNNLGARVLADLCGELEKLGHAGSLDNAAAKFSRLHHEYQRVISALSDELKAVAA